MTLSAAALVVGVGTYDESSIPILPGSLSDAESAVGWLCKIGVDPERILLHVDPVTRSASKVGFGGVTARGAGFDEILGSFDRLSKEQGDQLFVFLSGHGLYVAGSEGGAIFLAQDYGGGVAQREKNLRMEGFIPWMLSWRFRDQFVFYDACQNPSASVGRVSQVRAFTPAGLDGLTVRSENSLVVCYSAAPGQRAWDGDGRGVLVRHVVEQLDPSALAALAVDAQQQDAILYDWAAGTRQVDVRLLFKNVIAPAVTAEAALAGVTQEPEFSEHGAARRRKNLPILGLSAEPSCDFQITIVPHEAIEAVENVRLSILLPTRGPSDVRPVDNPLLRKGPFPSELMAICRTKPGAAWRVVNSPQRATLAAAPASLTFDFEPAVPLPPSGPIDHFNLRVFGPDGAAAFPITGDIYDDLEPPTRSAVTMERHEHGPDIAFDDAVLGARESAASWAQRLLPMLRQALSGRDLSVSLFPPGVEPEGRTPNLRFTLPTGAAGLAGYLAGVARVSVTEVGETAATVMRSPADIEAHPMEWVVPGAHRVAVALPWGRWTRLIVVPEDGVFACALPPSVGLPPLRNTWLAKRGEEMPPPLPAGIAARMHKGLRMPMLASAVGGEDRVEPFSATTLPEWDLMFTAGRLDGIDDGRIRQLVDGALPEGEAADLFLLGLAHAAFAREAWATVRLVLDSVKGTLRHSLDANLLGLSVRMRRGAKETGVQAANVMRYVGKADLVHAPPIVLRWSAGLIETLFADADAVAPAWLRGLSFSSVVAVRTEADRLATDRRIRASQAQAADRTTAVRRAAERDKGEWRDVSEAARAERPPEATADEQTPAAVVRSTD